MDVQTTHAHDNLIAVICIIIPTSLTSNNILGGIVTIMDSYVRIMVNLLSC